MAHEEQNDPVAQSSTSKSPTTSTADLSERDNKEIPVVKEEETNDTEVFEVFPLFAILFSPLVRKSLRHSCWDQPGVLENAVAHRRSDPIR
jgi:hypothetical protein